MHQWHAACLPFLLSTLAWSQCSKKITVINEQIWLCLCACVSSLWLINQMTSKKVRGMCVPDRFMGRRGHVGGWQVATSRNNNLEAEICLPDQLPTVCARARARACGHVWETVFSHAKGQDKDTKNRSNSKWQRREGKKGEISHYQRENTHTHTKQSHVSITSENTALTDILEIKSNCIHAIIKAACAIPNVQPDFKLGSYRVYWFMFSRHLAP